jgi:phosphopantetheinyl transferase (holo-ACP synthase)
MAAAAYSAEKSPGAGKPLVTGCDIQYVHPAKTYEGIVRGFFSSEEQAYIAAGSPERERITRFYRIWVLKECFLKALGLSVFDMNRAPSFVARGDLKDEINGPPISLRFYLYELGNSGSGRYLLAAAAEREQEDLFGCPPAVLWFSEESLPVSK